MCYDMNIQVLASQNTYSSVVRKCIVYPKMVRKLQRALIGIKWQPAELQVMSQN